MTCANAFWKFYKITNDRWALQRAVRACEFLTQGLNKTERKSGSIALSYTPLDRSQVVNTNADIASLLLRVGQEVDDAAMVRLSTRITRFVLETQNPDGGWNYNAPDVDGGRSKIDNYHTGMNLCALMDLIERWDVESPTRESLIHTYNRGLSYYLDRLFTAGMPRYTTKSLYPLDIYGFAQAIITLSRARKFHSTSPALSASADECGSHTIRKALELMLLPSGGFLYQWSPTHTVSLNSLRWANALMCSALLQAVSSETDLASREH